MIMSTEFTICSFVVHLTLGASIFFFIKYFLIAPPLIFPPLLSYLLSYLLSLFHYLLFLLSF